MRRTLAAAAGLMLLAGCGFFNKNLGLKTGEPGYQEPGTTSIFGDWVLASPTDSTAFAGARTVELTLQQGSFTIRADYPGQSPLVLRGSAVMASEGGALTLTPEAGTTGNRGAMVMSAGQPLTLLASAAGNTLVFKPPMDRSAEPSSVWHKKAKAKQAAGTTTMP